MVKRARVASAVVLIALAALVASAAAPRLPSAAAAQAVSTGTQQPTRTHRFAGKKRGREIVFHIRGLKQCSVASGGVRAQRRYKAVRRGELRRAIVHGVFRVRMPSRSAVLSISCIQQPLARIANASNGPPETAVNSSPDGPSAPAGGWSVAYGDAFTEPICGSQGTAVGGSGCDNTLFPNRNARTCDDIEGYDGDDLEVYNCSGVSVGSSGLDLSCTPATGLPTYSGSAAPHYVCGTVQSQDTDVPTGDKFFTWKPGQGQEWAVQIVAKFPQNTGEADPGWWSSDWAWTEEIDFFEAFGLQAGKSGSWCHAGAGSNSYVGTTLPSWIYNTSGGGELQAESSVCHDLGFDPAGGFHTYTTVFYPDNTFTEYIDGKPDHWSFVPEGGTGYSSGGDVAGPVPYTSNAAMGLILSYGLRDDEVGDPDPYFTSGTRNFLIRSIAVYENSSANGANAVNGGLAPGTPLSAS